MKVHFESDKIKEKQNLRLEKLLNKQTFYLIVNFATRKRKNILSG